MPRVPAAPVPLRLVEVAGVLSLATDLAMGQPLEHGVRTALLAVRIADALGLSECERTSILYTGLLHFAGCTAEGQIDADFFGDELAARPAMMAALFGSRTELVATAARHAHPELPLPRRMGAVARSAVGGVGEFKRWAASHCEVGQLLGDRMGLSAEVRRSLGHLYERWDGKGMPGQARGEQIPLPVRVMQVAQDADMAWQRAGVDAATAVVAGRAGSGLDPQVVPALLGLGGEAYAGFDEPSLWDELVGSEPGSRPVVAEDRVDACLSALADVADLKSFWTVGHSRGVGELAGAAGTLAGLAPAEAVLLRPAGLVHDLGRVAISAGVWAKPGPLTRGEREQVRLHAYHSERVLDVVPALRPLARLAGMHGERCDGSGYHRASRGTELPAAARLLAAADCYAAMREPRPYRPARSDREAAAELCGEAAAGRLDPAAVDAVLAAAGQPRSAVPAARPAGLSARECEVLGLLARGLATKQVASRLGISAKTCDHHIQRIYGKLGLSTRAGAALFAAEHGLVGAV